jgi:hypothetical protein
MALPGMVNMKLWNALSIGLGSVKQLRTLGPYDSVILDDVLEEVGGECGGIVALLVDG